MLIGRDPEQRLVESLLENARDGVSAALVIRGEAGIGKTAVIEHAAATTGVRTLRCAGVESEHDIAFAALQQLFRPVHELVEHLPDLQASALRTAFGLSSEPIEDRLLIGLATLNLLAEATEEGPLLCVVDDLQWLDGPSAQALLFAARRLGAEGIVILFAVRDGPGEWIEVPGLQQLTLGPLSNEAACEVIAHRAGPAVEQTAAARLLREAGGNPLALLELPLTEDATGDARGVDAAFRARIIRLPEETRQLLLLAAAAESQEARTWGELSRLAGLPQSARLPAVSAGLIGDLDTIVFRHPLVRSAIYRTSPPAWRAEAHRLLASCAGDALARVSHLAAAAEQPDESLAVELEAAGTAAASRGAFDSAASAFARAAALSVERETRVRCLTEAARSYLDGGRLDLSLRLAEEALRGVHTAPERAALAAVRGALEQQRDTPAAAYDLLVTAAYAVAREDPAGALELLGQAIGASFVAGWPERAFAEAYAFVQNVTQTRTAYDRCLRLFLDAMAAAGAGARERAHEQLSEVIRIGSTAEDFRLVLWAGLVSAYLGDLRSAREHCLAVAASARAVGSFSRLPMALLGLARLDVTVRAFGDGEDNAREGIELTRQLGQKNLETCFSALLVRCLAARGEVEECRELGEATLRQGLAHGLGVAIADVRLGLAELELSLGNGAAARDLIAEVSHPLLRIGAAANLVEAALMAGDPELARADLDALTVYSEQAEDPFFQGLVARAQALLAASPRRAEPLFQEALADQVRSASSFERARTELAYGEFLRREQRKTEARLQLRNALATFEGLNAPLWADRARAELEATGITARKRDPSTLDTLTPQELRIAKLVGAGASNREVAGQLFLSPKTIEYHLRKVFMKLDVSSRVELARQSLSSTSATVN